MWEARTRFAFYLTLGVDTVNVYPRKCLFVLFNPLTTEFRQLAWKSNLHARFLNVVGWIPPEYYRNCNDITFCPRSVYQCHRVSLFLWRPIHFKISTKKKKINLKKDILSRICSILLCLTLGCVGSELNTFYILREQFPNPRSKRVPRTILGIYLGIHRQHSVCLLSHTGKTEAPVLNGSSDITGS